MSYLKTKMGRKKTKYQNVLMKSLGVSISETPCKVLVICNGGLVNGITQEMIFDAFGKFGEVENIVMVPEKSFSFINFKLLNDAKVAYEEVNGSVVWTDIKGPLYLGFVEELPEHLRKTNFNFEKPSGLIILENFISPQEEDNILKLIGFQSQDDSHISSDLKHRKVKHYGYEFKYSTNNVSLDEPITEIPGELDYLWERLSNHNHRNDYDFDFNFKPDQLTVNCYEPGQGIPPHVDTHSPFTDGILSLSLQSDVIMDFKHSSGRCCSVLLPRRSLCIMRGEARYDWMHGITPRKSDIIPAKSGGLTLQSREVRTSLTFRKTRQGECECNYPDLCDSKKKKQKHEVLKNKMNMPVKENDAVKLEENYVHEVYEKIASHFSETRHKPWPNVAKFMESFSPGSILVDVGCGNGKYFSLKINRYEIGCDSSFNLMQVCRERGFECFTCNCLNLPLRDNIADGCISIAVIHHLATKERRIKAIEEIIRILKIGGKALIYVWAKNQERQNKKSSYLKQFHKKNEKKALTVEKLLVEENAGLPVHTNRTNFNHNDLLVPWKLKPKDNSLSEKLPELPVFLRFYHVFEDDEIKEMCLELKNVQIDDYYYDQGNWSILLQKRN